MGVEREVGFQTYCLSLPGQRGELDDTCYQLLSNFGFEKAHLQHPRKEDWHEQMIAVNVKSRLRNALKGLVLIAVLTFVPLTCQSHTVSGTLKRMYEQKLVETQS